jgi:hypothetical protein
MYFVSSEQKLLFLFWAAILLVGGTWQALFPERAIKWNRMTLPAFFLRPVEWLMKPNIYRAIAHVEIAAGAMLLLFWLYIWTR